MKYIDENKDNKESGLKLSNNDKLQFYAFYKMATIGECNSNSYKF